MPEADTALIAVSFAVYTALIVALGVYASRFATDTNEDFFLAGRSLGGWVAALSASASSESGWVTLGLVGWAYVSGVSAYWIIPGTLLGYIFNWFVLARRLRDRSETLGAVTLPDFLSLHFRERAPVLRTISVIVILLAMLLYVSAQFAAAGKAFGAVFGVRYEVGVSLGAGIVLLYTVTGGFRAVCWTDLLQALLMVGTLVVFPVWLLLDNGGVAFLRESLASAGPNGDDSLLRLLPAGEGAAVLAGFLLGSGALGVNFGYPGQPHVLVRFMALRSRREAIIGGIIACTWSILVFAGAVTVGLVARAMAAGGAEWTAALEADAEISLVLAALHLLPGVLSGLILAAVLAAICSTADSQLVVAASAGANDLYARLVSRSTSAHTLLNRITVAILIVIAVLIAVAPGEIKVYEFVLDYGWAILGAAFGPQVILALMWRRATWAGAVAGMLAGAVVAIVWKMKFANTLTIGETSIEVYNLTLAFVVALVVNMLVSLVTNPGRDD